MRKLISIPLVFIFLFNIGGYYLWFSVMQYGIQKEIGKEIAAGIKDEDLTLIVIPEKGESEIAWIKSEKEFRYKDEMYDVVKTKNLPGKKLYYCINDKKEKQLIAGFDKTHNNKKESEKRLKRTFNYSYYLPSLTVKKHVFQIEFTFPTINNFYTPNAIDIHSPPPKLVENHFITLVNLIS